METKNEEKNEKKVKVSTIVYSGLILIVVVFVAMSILAYGTNTQIGNRVAATVARIVPFPAVVIGYGEIIPLGAVEKNLASVKSFYENQDLSQAGIRIDFSTEDGKKRLQIKEKEVLNKMLEDRIVQMLAQKRGIKISQEEVDKSVERKLQEYGTKDSVEKDLQKLYGWSLADFKEKVVLPSMYQEQLQTAIKDEITSPEAAKKKIEQAKEALDRGTDFAEVVKTYSEGSSVKNAGEIGWVTKDQLVPELQTALFDKADSFKKNTVIESALGFHIVDVEEQKLARSNEAQPGKDNGDNVVLRIRQIFVRKETIADWLNDRMKEMKIIVPLNGFYWDKNKAVIDFSDSGMREFEQNLLEKSQGDASVMF